MESEHPQHPPGTSRGAEAPPLHRIKTCGSAVTRIADHLQIRRVVRRVPLLEPGSGADQGDEVGVDGAPAGLCGLMSLNAIATPAAREPGPLVTSLPKPDGGEGGLDRYLKRLVENGCDLGVCVVDDVVDASGTRRQCRSARPDLYRVAMCGDRSAGRVRPLSRSRRGRWRVGGVVVGSRRRVRGCGGSRFRGASQERTGRAGGRCARSGRSWSRNRWISSVMSVWV